jgi:hypothetical protein
LLANTFDFGGALDSHWLFTILRADYSSCVFDTSARQGLFAVILIGPLPL